MKNIEKTALNCPLALSVALTQKTTLHTRCVCEDTPSCYSGQQNTAHLHILSDQDPRDPTLPVDLKTAPRSPSPFGARDRHNLHSPEDDTSSYTPLYHVMHANTDLDETP